MNGSCHTYEWVMSHIYEWVKSYIWKSCVTHVNASCHTCSLRRMSHVTHMSGSCHTYVIYVCYESRHTWLIQVCVCHDLNESWHTYIRSVPAQSDLERGPPDSLHTKNTYIHTHTYIHANMHACNIHADMHMGWLRLVGSLKLQVSFAKEPSKRDYILQKRPIVFRSLLS